MRYYAKLFILLSLLLGGKMCMAQDAIEHQWYNDEKTAKIQIFKATDGKFYGKIVWLKEPLRDGKPKTDIHNPQKERQNDPIIGMQMLRGFKKDGDTHYEDGTIYDPKKGKTYSCKITNKGNHLDVRGYIGISLIGRTATWEKAE